MKPARTAREVHASRERYRNGASACRSGRRTYRSQAGYALLMVVFLVALMAIAVAAATPNLYTQGVRQREEEMIWRGEQYVRAIRRYYRKNGRFPQTVEDLTEKKTGIRYLRQAYRDPMNREDGSWRFIYVGPAGQLIGSVTRTSAIQLTPAQGGQTGQTGQPPSAPQPGKEEYSKQETPLGQPTSLPGTPLSTSPVMGGNIIGVASKVERPSLKVYNGRSTYREWEFIWDPSKDAAGVGSPISPGGGARPAQPSGSQQPPQRPPVPQPPRP